MPRRQQTTTEARMEHDMKVAADSQSNLPEILAVDLEQSSNVFQSKQLTAGAPAPGLADDGTKKRYPPPHSSDCFDPMIPSRTTQAPHQKYSDIFAPLDFNPPKRNSVSSSDYSADLEPPSISTRGESVLTVDTWLESERHPSPAFLHISPTSEYTAQSWIDLDVDELSPITQRRRSSMTDFPKCARQLQTPDEGGGRAMLSRSQPVSVTETPTTPIHRKPRRPALVIPERCSSLTHQEVHAARAAVQQWAQNLSPRETHHEEIGSASSLLPDDKPPSAHEDGGDTTSLEHEHDFAFQDSISKSSMSEYDGGLGIVSCEVDCDEWLKSDMTYLAREDQLLPRPLPPTVQERVELYATNFPVTLLRCNHLLVEDIRGLSQGVRYNVERPKTDYLTTSGHHPNNQQPKLSKWKWPGSSTAQQYQFNTPTTGSRQEWSVIRKVFPYGNDGLCDALYAYVLVYNYITSLCLRCPPYLADTSGPTRPWTARPDADRLGTFADPDLYSPTVSHPSTHGPHAISKKASRILGIEDDKTPLMPLASFPTPPPSGGGGSRTSTFSSLRNIPAVLFNGMSQGQQRHSENNGSLSRPATPTGRRGSSSRPSTPVVGWAGSRPATSGGSRGAEQARQLAEIRHGLAMCCARLTITLQRTGPNAARPGSDEDGKVVPSFMRSLCENVRFTEEAMGRSQ
ncbi:hypothetical protein SAMD00023353_2301440 [Rosellinia necatrix]|uniref:Uncharacterized protein n=1 Tax=Rosellinia necatrix TaxID=77044 RepID=A0A1W2TGB3_ROSNE|nr:hypothetical protein SAMD00023353_2301440 [Rosellinia necatrix]